VVATQGEAQKLIRNVGLFAGYPSPAPEPGQGGPNRYTGKQKEYFESPTRAAIWLNAKYASNYYKAHVQGIIPGDFETERGAHIRTQDIVEQTTGVKMPNDYQSIYFQDTRIKGLYTGAKVKYAGNTWLAISPFNVSDPMSSAVIRRCNAVWKHLDYYGNVLTEPFVFHDGRANATANEYLDYDVIPNWYQKCVMQLNDETRELAYNRRIALGSSVVEVRGVVDFVTDFSGDTQDTTQNTEPSHVMFFDVQFQQPTANDDMERGIADGKAFSWRLNLSYAGSMGTGAEQQMTVTSTRNGEAPDTEHHPVSYLFESSDASVLTVDADGKITSVGEGTATITVTLAQNPEITATAEITVSAEEPEVEIVFTPELPTTLRQMQTYTGTVAVMRGGATVGTALTMNAYGGTQAADAAFDPATGTLSITCYEASRTPLSLVFNVPDAGLTETRNIRLEGY
jgi:hypothetical protein